VFLFGLQTPAYISLRGTLDLAYEQRMESGFMRRSWMTRSAVWALAIGTILLLSDHRLQAERRGPSDAEVAGKPAAQPQALGADGQNALRAMIQSGNLAELRWPDFSDYVKHVQKFYELYGYSLPWVRGMQPSEQAQQVISFLNTAEQKGLRRASLERATGEVRIERAGERGRRSAI
jgi:hypothetical protein